MNSSDLKEARRKLGLNMTKMAALLRTPYRTYQDWEAGRRRIPGICAVAIKLLLHYKGAVKILGTDT
jgi:DNA-binding transcriptional regulator YiaG